MKVDILILNYNGKYLMEQFLSSVVKAAAFSRNQCRVMVVDNLSTDGSVDFLKSKFPSVKVFIAEKRYIKNEFQGSL